MSIDAQGASAFLLDPDKAELVAGRKKWAGTVPDKMIVFLVGMWIVFAAGILAYQAFLIWPEFWALSRHGAEVTGVVTDFRDQSSGGGSDYRVSYRFEPASGPSAGTSFTGEDSVNFRTLQTLKMGGPVTVHYASNQPSVSQLTPPSTLGAVLIVLTTVLINVGFLAVFLMLRRKKRRDERLAKDGRIVHGQVKSCSGRKDSEGHFQVEVQYSFVSPEGKTVEAVARRRRDDLKETHLPAQGTPVAVLVADERTFEIL